MKYLLFVLAALLALLALVPAARLVSLRRGNLRSARQQN